MKVQSVKGTRDFYPEDMAIRNWITDAWRRVSRIHGFQEYDGPILEHLDLYTAKSGEGIVSELFNLEDRGGRRLAIRPEMTPTLARMINARAQTLPRPIKWFSVPRLCRAERPQRGRLREFFQWNVDVVGVDDIVADAECILVAVDFFREVGLTADDFVMKINSRALMGRILSGGGVPDKKLPEAFVLMDRAEKSEPDRFAAMWTEQIGQFLPHDRLKGLLAVENIDDLESVAGSICPIEAFATELEQLKKLFLLLVDLGIRDCCEFGIHVIRGLAYYTGTVFEAFGKGELSRAICGGGRYDGLLKTLGGPAMSGVGFGTSDVVVQDVLGELNRLPSSEAKLDFFVIDASPDLFPQALKLVAKLRRGGHATDFSYRRQALGKQLKTASQRNARCAVILGEETTSNGLLTLKNLVTREQSTCTLAHLIASSRTFLSSP
jgi:histidyl-tRNA synthetase